MGDSGFVRSPKSLDPTAQEFTPINHLPGLLLTPPQFYYLFSYPSQSELPIMPFRELPAPPAYVRHCQPLPPHVPSPSRTLLLTTVAADVSESTVRRELEVYGDVRAVEMERIGEGIVTVHFYDLRNAEATLVEIQAQYMQQQCRMREQFDVVLTQKSPPEPTNFSVSLSPAARGLILGGGVWAQFIIPLRVEYPEGYNQGTLLLLNVDSQVSNNFLQEIFQAFGCIKELRETPNQRLVEFYDTRDAAKALQQMNGKEIQGSHIIIEFPKPIPQNTTIISTSRCCLARPPPHPPRQRCPDAQLDQSSLDCPSGGAKKTNGGGRVEVLSASICKKLPKKNSNKKSTNHYKSLSQTSWLVSIKQHQQQQKKTKNTDGSSNLWKGAKNSMEEYDPSRFLIKVENSFLLSNCTDPRTTVMIKNIPNKYSQKLLLSMLDNHCISCNEQIADDQPLSSYDFVYLPIDFINKCNVGYGFVNMTSPQATLRLYKSFHLQNWDVFNSRKICQITYARLQGLEALKEHFRSSKFPTETEEEYMPVVFSPPRDGRKLTNPVPIFM